MLHQDFYCARVFLYDLTIKTFALLPILEIALREPKQFTAPRYTRGVERGGGRRLCNRTHIRTGKLIWVADEIVTFPASEVRKTNQDGLRGTRAALSREFYHART